MGSGNKNVMGHIETSESNNLLAMCVLSHCDLMMKVNTAVS